MENNDENKERYSEIKGTGVLSAVIFSILLTFLMWLLSHFIK